MLVAYTVGRRTKLTVQSRRRRRRTRVTPASEIGDNINVIHVPAVVVIIIIIVRGDRDVVVAGVERRRVNVMMTLPLTTTLASVATEWCRSLS